MCERCDMEIGRAKVSLDPAIVALLSPLREAGLVTPDPAQVGITEARRVNEAYFRAISEPKVAVRSVSVVEAAAADGYRAPVKVAVPFNAPPNAPAILYCHGGGYAFGDIDTHDGVIRAYAAAFGMPVFGLHYRRTPEHAYPLALEDALAAVAAMRSEGWARQFDHDPSTILVIGDSAGAHLALTTMLALRERGLPQLSGAGLIYGMYARRFDTWSHHAYGDGSVGLSSDRMRWFWDSLMGQADSAHDPLKEPLNSDLSHLPPLTLFAAEVDCLLDDTLDFVETCKRQGHRHTFDLVRGMPHGFMHFMAIHSGTADALGLLARRMKAALLPSQKTI
jgi:acetyl esterase